MHTKSSHTTNMYKNLQSPDQCTPNHHTQLICIKIYRAQTNVHKALHTTNMYKNLQSPDKCTPKQITHN